MEQADSGPNLVSLAEISRQSQRNLHIDTRVQVPGPRGQKTLPSVPWALNPCLKRARGDRNDIPALLLLVDIATVHPGLDADDAERRVSLGETVVDVRAQRVQRETTLQIPLGAGDFVAVQAARHADLDALAAETQRRINRFAHRATERNALLELKRNALRDELSVELRLVHFEDVDEDFPRRALLDVGLELVDFRALAADDDARTRRADDQAQLVARTLHFHRRNAGSLELLAQLSLELDVFDEEFVVAALYKPARLPRL